MRRSDKQQVKVAREQVEKYASYRLTVIQLVRTPHTANFALNSINFSIHNGNLYFTCAVARATHAHIRSHAVSEYLKKKLLLATFVWPWQQLKLFIVYRFAHHSKSTSN